MATENIASDSIETEDDGCVKSVPASSSIGPAAPTTGNVDRVANYQYSKGLPKAPPDDSRYAHMPTMPGDSFMESNREKILSKFEEAGARLGGFNNISFLRRVTNGNYAAVPFQETASPTALPKTMSRTSWNFEDRRVAQPILPFLLLGPTGAAKDETFLKEQGISLVILVRDLRQEISRMLTPRTATKLGIETQIIEVGNDRLVSAFPVAIKAINDHLSRRFAAQEAANERRMLERQPADNRLPGRVLVYDLTGNEAAAAVCCAYVMAMYSISAGEAVFIVQSRRFSIDCQDCHSHVARYHDIIRATKDIGRDTAAAQAAAVAATALQASQGPPSATPSPMPQAARGRKRDYEHTLEELGNFSLEEDPLPDGQAPGLDVQDNSTSGTNRNPSADRRQASPRKIDSPFSNR